MTLFCAESDSEWVNNLADSSIILNLAKAADVGPIDAGQSFKAFTGRVTNIIVDEGELQGHWTFDKIHIAQTATPVNICPKDGGLTVEYTDLAGNPQTVPLQKSSVGIPPTTYWTIASGTFFTNNMRNGEQDVAISFMDLPIKPTNLHFGETAEATEDCVLSEILIGVSAALTTHEASPDRKYTSTAGKTIQFSWVVDHAAAYVASRFVSNLVFTGIIPEAT
ncbi:hypothetical protein AA313_de0205442 [Arthrobotrys entomopaga]|nr:hypothetical protein AA313_de0205442 [Arthrobotrys entomopaga]